MTRWTRWFPIDDPALRSTFRGFGIYHIRLVDARGQAVPVPRLAASDPSGTIYLGRSGTGGSRTVAKRVSEFMGGPHSGGRRWAKVSKVLKRRRALPGVALQVRAMLGPQSVERAEAAELRRYFNRFAELPPCNSSDPGYGK